MHIFDDAHWSAKCHHEVSKHQASNGSSWRLMLEAWWTQSEIIACPPVMCEASKNWEPSNNVISDLAFNQARSENPLRWSSLIRHPVLPRHRNRCPGHLLFGCRWWFQSFHDQPTFKKAFVEISVGGRCMFVVRLAPSLLPKSITSLLHPLRFWFWAMTGHVCSPYVLKIFAKILVKYRYWFAM